MIAPLMLPIETPGHPARLKTGLMQRLINPGLISAESAASLQHQRDLVARAASRPGGRPGESEPAAMTRISICRVPLAARATLTRPPAAVSCLPFESSPIKWPAFFDWLTARESRHEPKGKVALVTGSTSGIGLGIARALGREGADLMLNGFGDPA